MIDAQLQQRLSSLTTPLLADARYRLGLPETHLDGSIRPSVPFTRMAGVAVTVRLERAKDEASADLGAMIRAFEAQTMGSFSIMVIKVPEELHNQGIFGEGAATLGHKHGFVGALIDGAVRDTQELKEIEFPAFSRTISPGYVSVAGSRRPEWKGDLEGRRCRLRESAEGSWTSADVDYCE